MVPTLGGVHKMQILIRDLLKEFLQQIFGEERGGLGGRGEPQAGGREITHWTDKKTNKENKI